MSEKTFVIVGLCSVVTTLGGLAVAAFWSPAAIVAALGGVGWLGVAAVLAENE